MTNEQRVKQVIVIRRDLGMRRGKEIAQGSHAAMAWLTDRLRMSAFRDIQGEPSKRLYSDVVLSTAETRWVNGLFTKVVVQVPDEAALLAVFSEAQAKRIVTHLITDSGLTEFAGKPTHTALAVGPDYEETIDLVTKHLKLY